jgi:Transglutaminase-like superfamily
MVEQPQPDSESAAPRATSRRDVNPVTTAVAATISACAAAWMVGGIFRDFTAVPIAVSGALLGGGIVAFSYRLRNGSWLQYTVVPLALLFGAILVAPDSAGATNGFIGLISDAARSAHLLQPPIAFDPGWRAILVVVFSPLAAAAATLGARTGKPKLGVALPVPLTMLAALVQPASSEIPSVIVAVVLVVLAATLAYGAEISGARGLSAAFETRRLMRGGAVSVGIAICVLGLSSVGFLFPQPDATHVIPPQKPQLPPSESDKVLFTYDASRPVPLHTGVIDTYDTTQNAWLLPPYDATRLKRLDPPASVPQAPGVTFKKAADDIVVHVTIGDAGDHALPDVAGTGQVTGVHEAVDYDPLTGALTTADRPVHSGLSYTVVGAPIATGAELAASGAPPKSMQGYLTGPRPPQQVLDLLAQYSQRSANLHLPEDAFSRLEFLRGALYQNVTAAGSGVPKDVGAARVVQMLKGGEANPYEIVAAEGLLARWAGVPSRIAYGYYGGVPLSGGRFEVHPVHGAMWLEVYFNHHGWQAIVGVPPKAKPSTSTAQKNQLNIPSTQSGQLIVYIPVQLPTITLLFQYVQWYLAHSLPIAALIVLALVAYPWLFKLIRRLRRNRWARGHGLEGRITVAYAEFRDRCRDLSVGDPAATPIAFLRSVEQDDEHEELAWLVSRALWGDLRRDLQEDDAAAAERLSTSVRRRIARAQPVLTQAGALVARTSLRQPYTTEVPNFWHETGLRFAPREWLRARRVSRRRRLLLQARGLAAVVCLALVGTVVLLPPPGVHAQTQQTRKLPTGLVPRGIGKFSFKPEPEPARQYRSAGSDSLVDNGLVYSIHDTDNTDGAVEIALFKPSVDVSDIDDESRSADCADSPVECPGHEVFAGVQQNLGSGHFHRLYFKGYERAYEMQVNAQTIFVWFPPGTQTMVMLITIGQLTPAQSIDMFEALMDFQHHHPQAGTRA